MATHAAVHVVVVERVARIAVEQGCIECADACRVADHSGLAATARTDYRQQLAITGIVRAREGGSKKVEHTEPRGSDCFGGISG